MTKYLSLLTVCTALAITSAACGADDDDDGKAGSGGGAGISGGGAAGGSAAGRSGSGAAGSMAMSGVVMCGGATCTSGLPMIPGVPAGLLPAPCCLTATNTCGVSMNNGPCMMKAPPPMMDPRCPGARMGMNGCCINGDCGQDGSIFGMGCVENGAAARATMGLFPIPPPKKCDAPTTTPDAGAMMGDDAGQD